MLAHRLRRGAEMQNPAASIVMHSSPWLCQSPVLISIPVQAPPPAPVPAPAPAPAIPPGYPRGQAGRGWGWPLQADEGTLLRAEGDHPSAGSRHGAGLANALGLWDTLARGRRGPSARCCPTALPKTARSFKKGPCLPISLSC